MHHWHRLLALSSFFLLMSSAIGAGTAHGVRRLFPDLNSLHTTLDTYASNCHSNQGGSDDFASLWHPLSMRRYVDHAGTLKNIQFGKSPAGDDTHFSGAATVSSSDFSLLSLDFMSPVVCAVKVQVSVGSMRYTNVLSLLRGPSTWQIVQELSSTMDLATVPSGCMLTPILVPVPVSSDFEGLSDEEAIQGIRNAAQTYLIANHVSDVALMKTCMDPSTVLFNVDAATSQITGRTAAEYFALMETRAGCTIEEVMQYDAVLKIDRISRDCAVATVTLGLPQLDGRLYTDQLFMLRCRGADGMRRWTIVNKSWTLHKAPNVHVIPPPPPLPN